MRHNWKAVHVRTLAELPEKLQKGRAYFIDDEGIILVDHGDNRGIQVYGNKQGPQGIPGEPLPQIFEDIDALAKANLHNTKTLYSEIMKRRESISQVRQENQELLTQEASTRENADTELAKSIALHDDARIDSDSNLQTQLDTLAHASVTHSKAIYNEVLRRRNAEAKADNQASELREEIDKLAHASLIHTRAIYNETLKRKLEAAARENADKNLQNLLAQESTSREHQDNLYDDARIDSDSNLQTQLDTLAHASVTHSKAIYNEAVKRRQESQSRKEAISNEAYTRENQDINLQSQLDTLAKASVAHARVILNEYRQRRLESLTRKLEDSKLQDQTDTLAKAVIRLTQVIAKQSKLLAHIWEKSGIKAEDMKDTGWLELLSDVFDDSDNIDNSTGEINKNELDSIQDLISDVFDDSDTHDDSQGSLEESSKSAINEIISEIFG